MEELDNQTDAIDDHLIKIASLEPTEDEDVSMIQLLTPLVCGRNCCVAVVM